MSPSEEAVSSEQPIKKLLNQLQKRKIQGYLIGALLVIVLIAILSMLAAFGINVVFPSNWQGFKLSKLTELGPHSEVQLSISDQASDSGRLQIDFKILPTDQINVSNFSNRLGVNQGWSQGIGFQLNKAVIDKLKVYLPLRLNLTFRDNQVSFSNGQLLVLNSGLPVKMDQYASGSGLLILKSQSEKDFDLDIKDPGAVLIRAIGEGKLSFSSQLDGLKPVIAQISEIHLQMMNGQVDGFIRLK